MKTDNPDSKTLQCCNPLQNFNLLQMKPKTLPVLMKKISCFQVVFATILMIALMSNFNAKAGVLDSVWVGPQIGTLTYGTAGSVTFKVYMRKAGNGGTGNITVGVTGLST